MKPTANSRRSQLLREGYELAFRNPDLTNRAMRAEWAVAYADRQMKPRPAAFPLNVPTNLEVPHAQAPLRCPDAAR
jgi:hypothetical protein